MSLTLLSDGIDSQNMSDYEGLLQVPLYSQINPVKLP